ncbi:hypothetical protein LB505_000837 [Fusarium chuoi]|nr:hypothetical protein LB505_000837 [Fusarium chuoi]
MSIQLTIAVTVLSVLLQLIGIYAKSFLKHTGDPRTHALLTFAQYPPYTLLNELMLLDYPLPVIPSGTWPIFNIFYYLFHKQCIILYLQSSAVRLTFSGIQALRKGSWSPFVNMDRPLDKMTRKYIAKVIIFDGVICWALAAFLISGRAHSFERARGRLQLRVGNSME